MKFAVAAVMSLLLAEQTSAFAPFTPVSGKHNTNNGRYMAMDMDMPPAAKTEVPVIQSSQYGPTDVRYSDFLRLVGANKVEKVTFSSDGSQLLGVDVDGTRIKIEALPNDPDLLTQLTAHKVNITKPTNE
jgi:cell division protease FtsH